MIRNMYTQFFSNIENIIYKINNNLLIQDINKK